MLKRKRSTDSDSSRKLKARTEVTASAYWTSVAPFKDSLQQTSSPPSSFSSPKPLTEANLQLLTGIMPPKKDQPSTPTNTPSRKSNKSISINTKLPLHELLAANNMPMDDREALHRHPEILQWAKEIRDGKRNSGMKTLSQEKLMARREQYQRSNEDTFVRQFFDVLLRDEREKREESKEQDEQEKWVKRTWDQDGLQLAWNQQFQKECIPRILTPDALTRKVLNSNPRIKDPKPDITYGISSKPFSEEQTKTNRAYYQQTGICPSLWHPFFLVEAKMKGTIQDAEYQCVRGGAALVNAGQQLRYFSGVDLDPGPDKETAVFSLAVTPHVIELNVHWAEKLSNGETRFHMNHLYGYVMKNEGVGRELRHDIDNILDWATLTRKTQVDDMLNKIATRVKNNSVRMLPTPSNTIEDISAANHDDDDNDEGEDNGDGDDEDDEDGHDGDEDDEIDDGGVSQLMGSTPIQAPVTPTPAHKKRKTGSD